MTKGSVSRRYARALIELAEEKGQVDQILGELLKFQEFARTVDRLVPVLSDKVIAREKRQQVLTKTLKHLAPSELFIRYMNYLLERERFGYFHEIVQAYRTLCDQRTGLIRAKVTTAATLEKSLSDRIEMLLTKKTGKKVVVEYLEDPSLIGGVRVQLGSRVYDGSVQRELARFQENMLKETMG